MEQRRAGLVREPMVGLVLAGVAAVAWAGWLGWDQQRDVQADGSTTGPYQAWQVIGLVLTLLGPLYWAASRRHIGAAVAGIPLGLTVCAYVDWSDDASGLFVIGVGMVLLGSLAATAAVTAVAARAGRATAPRGDRL
ncbi:hypothetical protein ABZZ79_27250 [Streptomyces sp. NPDC006458]|uniref:hypothetical protein n=1 Tax=Streptomyces sp. NPDC006458 TaxID=3154302 RepID=UPI0033AA9A24